MKPYRDLKLVLIALAAVGCGRAFEVKFVSDDQRVDAAPTSADPDSFNPMICSAEGQIHVVWADDRFGASGVFYQRSTDGGVTWMAEARALSTPGAIAGEPNFRCDGTDLYVVWEDARAGIQGHTQPYYTSSIDGGRSWSEERSLSLDENGRFTSRIPRVYSRGTSVWVTWFNNMYGAYDIFAVASFDRGRSFTEPMLVNSSVRGSSWSGWPELRVQDDGGALIVWEDLRDGKVDLYLSASADGLTWTPDQRVNTGVPPGTAHANNARFAVEGDTAVVVWQDQRDGEGYGIYLNWSNDRGQTWLESAVRVDGAQPGLYNGYEPQVALVNGTAHIVWYDERLGAWDVYYRSARDGVVHDDEQILDGSTTATDALYPKLAVEGDTLLVVWEDHRNDNGDGYSDLYYTYSTDAGLSWAPEVNHLQSWDLGVAVAVDHEVALVDGEVQAVWSDNRYGTYDVLFTRLALGEAGYTPAEFRERAP